MLNYALQRSLITFRRYWPSVISHPTPARHPTCTQDLWSTFTKLAAVMDF